MPRAGNPELEPVVTGYGVVSSIGRDAPSFWASVLGGRSGAAPVRAFDPAPLRNTIACEVEDAALDGVPSGPTLARASRLAVRAAGEAMALASLTPGEIETICVGTTMGDMPALEDAGFAQPTPITENAFAARIAAALRIAAPAMTVVTSCSAGNLAIFRAADLIVTGRASRVLAGGADAMSRLAFTGFSRMRAMAPSRCAPFDRDRKGILLGEGAAFMTIESRASAERRGATPYAAIAGYGLSCDAHHISTPAPDGRGAAAAMRRALEDAGLDPSEVDYVAAHGTGTAHNDAAEAAACAAVFGSHRPFVSSLKALTGHTLGAASAVQAVACTLALGDGRVPPAWHADHPDPACDVELPRPGAYVDRPLRVAISNGLAFGGNNSCLVLRSIR